MGASSVERRDRADATALEDEALPMSGWRGPFPGTVVSTEDPLRRGRVRVRAPQCYGSSQQEEIYIPDDRLPWARPAFPCHDLHSGWEPGDGVWVIFWGETNDNPVLLGQWLGEAQGASDVPDEFISSYTPDPKTRLLRTRNGHQIEMRWVEGQEYIRVKTAAGHVFEMLEPTATTAGGPKIALTLLDQKRIELDGLTQAINIIAPAGQINVTAAAGAVNVTGQGVNVQSTGTAPTTMAGGGTLVSSFVGAANYTFGGILAFIIAGAWTVTAASVTITAATFAVVGVLSLGVAGVKYKVAHAQLFILLQDMMFVQATHTHPVTTAPGTTGASNINTATQAGAAPRAGGLTNVPAGNVSLDVNTMTAQNLEAN